MKVLVIGAHGQVGKKVVDKLHRENHEVIAMIRDEAQKSEFEKKGVRAVVADLEKDISHAFEKKMDAVIFTAGSGAETSSEKTTAVDLQGARKSIDEAKKHHVDRYIMVSALGTNEGRKNGGDMQHYFAAKSEADQHLVQSALNYTIFRPGKLTNEDGSGNVQAAESLEEMKTDSISRTNLANAIVKSLDKPNTYKKVIEIVDGQTPIGDAIHQI